MNHRFFSSLLFSSLLFSSLLFSSLLFSSLSWGQAFDYDKIALGQEAANKIFDDGRTLLPNAFIKDQVTPEQVKPSGLHLHCFIGPQYARLDYIPFKLKFTCAPEIQIECTANYEASTDRNFKIDLNHGCLGTGGRPKVKIGSDEYTVDTESLQPLWKLIVKPAVLADSLNSLTVPNGVSDATDTAIENYRNYQKSPRQAASPAGTSTPETSVTQTATPAPLTVQLNQNAQTVCGLGIKEAIAAAVAAAQTSNPAKQK